MTVEPKAAAAAGRRSEHKGQPYYFCSDECKKQFDAEPARTRPSRNQSTDGAFLPLMGRLCQASRFLGLDKSAPEVNSQREFDDRPSLRPAFTRLREMVSGLHDASGESQQVTGCQC